MKKTMFFFVMTIFLSVCFSQQKYRLHGCERNEKCNDGESFVLSFKVDINTDKVLMRLHDGNSIIKTSIFDKEDCKVFDDKNWICRPEIEGKPLYEYRMENGNLSYERFTSNNTRVGVNKKYFWSEKN